MEVFSGLSENGQKNPEKNVQLCCWGTDATIDHQIWVPFFLRSHLKKWGGYLYSHQLVIMFPPFFWPSNGWYTSLIPWFQTSYPYHPYHYHHHDVISISVMVYIHIYIIIHMVVYRNRPTPSHHPYFDRTFPYKPSSDKGVTPIDGNLHIQLASAWYTFIMMGLTIPSNSFCLASNSSWPKKNAAAECTPREKRRKFMEILRYHFIDLKGQFAWKKTIFHRTKPRFPLDFPLQIQWCWTMF